MRTPYGSLHDVGTQFIARVDDEGLQVGVRDGRVAVARESNRADVGAGEKLVFEAASSALRRDTIATFGEEWAWIERVAPPFPIDGRTLADFLTWLSAQTGREVLFDTPATETLARATVLRGSIDLDPMSKLAAVIATTDFSYMIDGGAILISSTRPSSPEATATSPLRSAVRKIDARLAMVPLADELRGRSRFLLLLACCLCAAAGHAQNTQPYRGRSVQTVIEELRAAGAPLVYSSNLLSLICACGRSLRAPSLSSSRARFWSRTASVCANRTACGSSCDIGPASESPPAIGRIAVQSLVLQAPRSNARRYRWMLPQDRAPRWQAAAPNFPTSPSDAIRSPCVLRASSRSARRLMSRSA